MLPEAASLDLASLGLGPGEGRRLELAVRVGELRFAGQPYAVSPDPLPVLLEVSHLTGPGFALRLALRATLCGACMRCLKEARSVVEVEGREVSTPGGHEELESPYVEHDVLDLAGWARDALVLNVPVKVLCREDCPGLCPVCAADLAEVGGEHRHEAAPDPRWAKLREIIR